MSGTRPLLRLGLLLGVAAWSLVLPGSPLTGQESGRRDLEQRILDSLARGPANREAMADWLGSYATAPRTPPRTRSTEAEELDAALHALLAASDGVLAGDSPTAADLARLLPAFDAVRAADLLFRERLAGVRRRLSTVEVGADVLQRLEVAEAAYLEDRRRFLQPLEEPMEAVRLADGEVVSPETIARLVDALARVAPWLKGNLTAGSPPVLRSSLLPYRPGRLPPRPLALTPTVAPSYAVPGEVAVDPADLAASPAAPLSEAILRQAAELGNDYVRIYEFVRNEIRTEWYAGAMKGAEGTLLQRSGNDVDQASLLVALLRASQAPARYVRGVIELPLSVLAEDLGVPGGRVTTALTAAGIAHRTVIEGGQVNAVRLEHTWVSAQIPYSNYRGAVVDFSGPTWLPLFPALAHMERSPATGILTTAGISLDALLDESLAAPQATEPMALLRQRIEAYLDQSGGGARYEDQLARESVVSETLRLLPSSLPVQVVAVTGESASLEAAEQHGVRIVVRSGDSETDPVILDYRAPLFELLGNRITVSYQPATVDDHTTVNLFGGLDAVPLFLVHLRPQIMMGGRRVAVAQGSLEAGVDHRLEIELSGPFGSESVSQTLTAGGYLALAFTGQLDLGRPIHADDPSDSEFRGARLLSGLALRYSERWGAAETELARLMDAALFRPLPAVVIAANAVEVETVLGLPSDLRWRGVTLDAAMRVAEPVARVGGVAATARQWLRFSALQGSALEHLVFEDEFLVESISADKGIGLAREAGIEVLRIDAGSLAASLPLLDHPPAVVAEVDNWVRLGRVVEIPRGAVSLNGWRGSVWRVEDPTSGAGGYFLSGRIAGGATSQVPENWILDFLADALRAPYSSEPNTDPLAGVSITKLGASDGQRGTVGEVLPTRLAVLVRDADGRPVKGALVQFEVRFGGGQLIDDEGAAAGLVETLTDELGIASTGLRLGERTADNPVYVLRNSGDQYATQALVNDVEAVGLGATGPLVLGRPFELLAMPDSPNALRRTDPHGGFGIAGLWSDSIIVALEDRFGNPISNAPVTFAVGGAQNTCDPPPPSFSNAAVFDNRLNAAGVSSCPVPQPTLGECGSSSVTQTTSVRGASAGVILGNSNGQVYRVDVSAPGVPTLSYDYLTAGGCSQREELRAATSVIINEFGRNINAAKIGETFQRPVQVTLLYSDPDYEVRVDGDGKPYLFFLPSRKWVRTTGNVQFTVSNGGSASGAQFIGDGTYQTFVTTGPTPGINTVRLEATGVQILVNAVDDAGNVFQEAQEGTFSGDLADVFGVDPRIIEVTPDPLLLTDSGTVASDGTVRYRIAPSTYTAGEAQVDILKDGELTGTAIGGRSGVSEIRLQRGLEFDVTVPYAAQLVLNRGSSIEMKSETFPLPLRQRIFTNVSRSVFISQDVDILNQRVCAIGKTFRYTLTQDATVTLTFKRVQSENLDGTLNFGAEEVLIDGELQTKGDHELLITPSDLLPADYEFELLGVSAVDGHDEIETGFARSEFTTHDSLPVGHAMVEGIDLFDGHLALTRDDFSLPGRGAALSFSRNYSSNAPTEGGPLGVGWSHNLGSKILITRCGEVILVGGEGSGMRFVDDGQGGLRPLKGFHGSLVANPADSSFDFYAKNGNRSHYTRAAGSTWRLDWVEDPNHNRTSYVYDTSGQEPKLVSVRDAGGRTVELHWERMSFRFWQGDVITSVAAAGGYSLDFEYDVYGNLVRTRREGVGGVERYDYGTPPEGSLEARHRLLAAVDEVTGATTTYTYDEGVIGIQGTLQVPNVFVASVREPAGGNTAFTYDTAALASRATIALTTRVEDPNGNVTTHTLNGYGSPLEIVDGAGNSTRMTWADDDVVMLSRTDGNGATTTFTYDEHANPLSESITVGGQTLQVLNTYWPPQSFDPPYVKNRLRSRTDRNGVLTELTYDSRGNLVREQVTGLVSSYTYDGRGDRLSFKNRRGVTTFYSYDAYGNLSRTTDPMGGRTETVYDVRSRPLQRTDTLGRLTTFAYDDRNRLVRQDNPGDEVETTTYQDAARATVQTDAEGRQTTTELDLEGRPVQVTNPAGGVKVLQYDAAGNKILESLVFDDDTPRFDITFAYDGANRLTRKTEPAGRVTEYVYDGAGNELRQTRSGGAGFSPRVTEWTYDELGRQTSESRQVDGGPAARTWEYDGEGNRTAEIDPLGRRTTWTYDGLGRMTQETAPLGRTRTLTYDGNGNPLSETKSNESGDQIRTSEYDTLDRPVKRIDALGNATLYEYDKEGNRTREIDPRLNVRSFAYDGRNRLVRETTDLTRVSQPPRNLVHEYTRDKVGNVVEERLPNGNVIRRTFDPLNRMLTAADSVGELTTFTHDARGNVLVETDGNANAKENVYDALDRRIEQRLTEGRTLRFTYDVAGNVLTRTDANGNVFTMSYDSLDRLVEAVDPPPLSFTTRFTYDLAGNKLTEVDRRGSTTRFEYDDLDRLTRIVDPPPLSYAQQFTYDRQGNRTSSTDRRGTVTLFRYDRENRLTDIVRDGLQVEHNEYDQNGNKRFHTDARANITGFEYDERNLLLARNRPLASITRFVRDDMGDVVEERDPEGRVTQRVYDRRQRILSETNGAGETTTFTYDGDGNRTATTRPEGGVWSFRYDASDRIVEVENPMGDSTLFGYDTNGNRTSIVDANGHETRFEYDELNRTTARVLPDGSRVEMDYDENGNLAEVRDPLGQTTQLDYDVLQRETERRYLDPATPTGDDLQSVATVYDPNGNPVQITESYSGATGARITAKSFDNLDRLTSVTDPQGERISYVYDANGNRTRMQDPDGRVTDYAYDALDRVESVSLSVVGVTRYDYLRNDLLRRITYPNGSAASYTYDGANRVKTVDNTQSSAPVSHYEYRYDRNGNRIEQLETNGGAAETTTYSFDAADRLLGFASPRGTTVYILDGVGNRLSEEVRDAGGTLVEAKSYSYDSRDRLLELTDSLDPSADTTYDWDANGNQIASTRGGTTTQFAYSVRDRLVGVARDGNPLASFLYDHQGLRVRKATAGGAVRYVWDDQSLALETDDLGTTVAKYDYGPDRLLTLGHATDGRQFYLFDALHSVVDLTTPTGAVKARYQYDPWGNLLSLSGASENLFRFTGHQFDEETGLYYAKSRFYDAESGRFLRADPAEGDVFDPPSLHRYHYAKGNPTVYVDPTGRYAESGHYYTTYYVALRVGFSEADALELAFFSQIPDEVSEYDAVANQVDALLEQGGNILRRAAVAQARAEAGPFVEFPDIPDRTEAQEHRDLVQRSMHSLTGGKSQKEADNTVRAIAQTGDDLATTGVLIHRLADTFAHRDLDDTNRMYDTGAGHGWDMHRPDVIQRRPDLYKDYVDTLADALAKKRGIPEEQRAALVRAISQELQPLREFETTELLYIEGGPTPVDKGDDRLETESVQTMRHLIAGLKEKVDKERAQQGLPPLRLNLDIRPEEASFTPYLGTHEVEEAVKELLGDAKLSPELRNRFAPQRIREKVQGVLDRYRLEQNDFAAGDADRPVVVEESDEGGIDAEYAYP